MSDNDFKTTQDPGKPKCYVLDMFPYPSGEGLHMGHVKVYTASDIYARYKRMKGFNVLHPTGFDAFGLPAEQFALKNKIHPRISTDKNVATYLRQMKALNFSYDYDRVIDTTDYTFYKWTQWIFKQIYKKGLAYESYEPINWCPSCKTGLANEDLEGGACERCGMMVEKKPLRQWVLKITDYADRLIDDLDTLTRWPQSFIDLEKNWIGRSEGAEFDFQLEDGKNSVKVFTTRADTLFGATFIAISPELASTWLDEGLIHDTEVQEYVIKTLDDQKKNNDYSVILEKTGIFSGMCAINPATKEKIPVWVANYVVGGVGTGALMAVPAHDERDYEFAKKYNLPVKQVIAQETGVLQENPEYRKSVVVVVYNPKEKKYLSLNWGSLGGNLFIGGGVNEGEDLVTTAIREIKEETGYSNLKYISKTGTIFHSYFAHSKSSARKIEATGLLFELVDELQGDKTLEDDEKDKFTLEWLSENDILSKINDELHSLVFVKVTSGSELYIGEGVLVDSKECNGLSSEEAKVKIVEAFGGKKVVRYKLQDWIFARQRYWGEPFPIVFDENHTSYVVADSELPVKLPDVQEYEPTGTGESPLHGIKEWAEVYGYLNDDNEFISCEKTDIRAKLFTRETNTMPQWAGSSWYYLRFIDPHNASAIFDKGLEKYWQPVDVYVGGAEHATRHLIYARFWHKFLYDIGVVSTIEPFTRLESVGLILGEGGVKMSKRLGNVINPDDVIKEYGSDVARMYVMFMGPFGQSSAWDSKSIQGVKKFLDRVKRLAEKVGGTNEDLFILNQSIKKIGDDIEDFKFNTSISQLMILLNHYEDLGGISKSAFATFLKLLAPFAPETTDELWRTLEGASLVHTASWPDFDEKYLLNEEVVIALQVNGKMRGTIEIARDSEDSVVLEAVKGHEMYQKYVGENEPKKVIIVKNKIINIVV